MGDRMHVLQEPLDDGRARPRPLSKSELAVIRSGSGYARRRNPGAHAEHNPDMQPYRARGFGINRPGHFHEMARRNPKIAGALRRRELSIAALDWRIVDPPEASSRDRNRSAFLRRNIRELEGGLPAIVEQKFRGTETYGFALFEKVWEIDEERGWWKYERLAHIEPWTVKTWVVDRNGYLEKVIFRFEGEFADDEIDEEKLCHFARRFNGRNYEGESALRSLYYWDEQKRKMAVGNAITFERAGEGVAVITMAGDFPAGSPEYNQAVALGQAWASGSQAFMVLPPVVEKIEFQHAGSEIPDFGGFYQYVDHQVDVVLGGGLNELGHSPQGARALGTEMRKEDERATEGLCRGFCHDVEQKVFVPLWDRNGWDAARIPRLTVSGFEDAGRIAQMMEMVRGGEGPIVEKTDEDVDKLRRAVGFGPGDAGG